MHRATGRWIASDRRIALASSSSGVRENLLAITNTALAWWASARLRSFSFITLPSRYVMPKLNLGLLSRLFMSADGRPDPMTTALRSTDPWSGWNSSVKNSVTPPPPTSPHTSTCVVWLECL